MSIEDLCVCGKPRREHDLERCDKRCVETNCPHFRLAAYQPHEVIVHRHSHGPKPGKGMPGMVPVK